MQSDCDVRTNVQVGAAAVSQQQSVSSQSVSVYKRKFNGYPVNLVFGIPDTRKTNYQFLRRT